MKSFLQKMLTIWTIVRFVFSHMQLKVTHGLCFLIHASNRGKGNTIQCQGGQLSKAEIVFQGNGNQILVYGKATYVHLQIEGNDNLVEFDEKCDSKLSSFLLRGNHCRIKIGKDTEILGMNAVCQGQSNEITIGNACLFSTDIELWASDTHTIYDENGSICNHSKSIHIGDHVWLGKGVAVLKGCSIANGSVIGMRSLVTRDIPAKVIAAGNPAKVIKSNVIWDRAFIDL